MFHVRFNIVRHAVFVFAVFGSLAISTADAQFRGGGSFTPPTPEESFQRMDRNGNGTIDRDEIESLPSFIRDMYTRQGIDGSRPVSKNEFLDLSQKMRDDMRARFERGEFGRGPGGSGGPPSFGGPPLGSSSERRPETPRPEESEDRDYRRDDRRRDERREEESKDRKSSSSSSGKSKKVAKPKARVTKDLPNEYRERDKNGDGQIGLYEWDRKAFAKFQELDRNSDGFLTPGELIVPAPKKNSDNGKAATAVATASTSVGSTKDSSSAKDSRTESKSASSSAKSDTPGDTAFRSLDVNSDGQLDADEWDRARSARKRFDKAGITVSLPMKQSQFVELYAKANDK